MDYKKEVGQRIRLARREKGWEQKDLEARTPGISLRRISDYETGKRMPRQPEAVILAQALGKRAAWIMAVDDIQLPITLQEESLIRNWRALPERDRMDLYRKVEALALTYRDPVSDARVELHIPPPEQQETQRDGRPVAKRQVKK